MNTPDAVLTAVQLIEDDAECVHISGEAQMAVCQQLRWHVTHSAIRCRLHAACQNQLTAQAEVSNLQNRDIWSRRYRSTSVKFLPTPL